MSYMDWVIRITHGLPNPYALYEFKTPHKWMNKSSNAYLDGENNTMVVETVWMTTMEAEDGGGTTENTERWRRKKLRLRHHADWTREPGF